MPSGVLPALLLLASAAPVVLTDDVFSIPRGEWRWVRFVVKQQPITVDCFFEEISKGPGVRLELLSKTDLLRFGNGQRHETLASTPAETSGEIERTVSQPGEYAVLLVSSPKAREAESVRLIVRLNFTRGAQVRYMPPGRQFTVILISFAAFFAIVTLSGRKLLRAFRGGIRDGR